MEPLKIKIGGFGGQGIILSGYITGKAAAIYDNKNATLTQSYGPESRGSACSAQLIISNEEVDYPKVTIPDYLLIMSQEAFDKFTPQIRKNGILIYDEDLAQPTNNLDKSLEIYTLPATRYAEELGKRIIANMVLLGFFTAVSEAVATGSMEKAINTTVPESFKDINIKAFKKGYESGIKKMKKKK